VADYVLNHEAVPISNLKNSREQSRSVLGCSINATTQKPLEKYHRKSIIATIYSPHRKHFEHFNYSFMFENT
jgi:hypothetical protein